jgi:hypothetical protein
MLSVCLNICVADPYKVALHLQKSTSVLMKEIVMGPATIPVEASSVVLRIQNMTQAKTSASKPNKNITLI